MNEKFILVLKPEERDDEFENYLSQDHEGKLQFSEKEDAMFFDNEEKAKKFLGTLIEVFNIEKLEDQ